mmetsp:Transcript_21217/g.65717  ORF Transcript_21217/g.65717 Transcript_21217/m.65717 type:complete len:234 (+) Transcript_21217:411-1112(+)
MHGEDEARPLVRCGLRALTALPGRLLLLDPSRVLGNRPLPAGGSAPSFLLLLRVLALAILLLLVHLRVLLLLLLLCLDAIELVERAFAAAASLLFLVLRLQRLDAINLEECASTHFRDGLGKVNAAAATSGILTRQRRLLRDCTLHILEEELAPCTRNSRALVDLLLLAHRQAAAACEPRDGRGRHGGRNSLQGLQRGCCRGRPARNLNVEPPAEGLPSRARQLCQQPPQLGQ